jgi:LTXXQ motif family protein
MCRMQAAAFAAVLVVSLFPEVVAGGGFHGGGGSHGGGGFHGGGFHSGGFHGGGFHGGGFHGGGFHGGGFHGGGFHGGGFHGGGFRGGGFHIGRYGGGMPFNNQPFGRFGNRFFYFGGRHFVGRPFARSIVQAHQLTHYLTIGRCSGNSIYGFVRAKNGLFSRNAFGTWNGWNSRWQLSPCGWFGPAVWPYLYGDVLTFALWPYVHNNPFWGYDVDAVLDTILSPGLYVADSHGLDVFGVDVCGALAPGVPRLPVDRIEQTVRPSGGQIASFDALKSASLRVSEFIPTSCPSGVPGTPQGRVEVVQKRLAAMREIVQILRTPLADFYNSLTDEQRRRLDGMPTANLVAAPKVQAFGPAVGAAALCDQRGAEVPQTIQDVSRKIQLTQQQQLAFDSVKSASSQAVGELEPSCPGEIADTISDRLTAIDARLRALLAAVNILRPAVVGFYASLDSEQRGRFNPTEPTSESHSEQQENLSPTHE